jgi:hypothetical protein
VSSCYPTAGLWRQPLLGAISLALLLSTVPALAQLQSPGGVLPGPPRLPGTPGLPGVPGAIGRPQLQPPSLVVPRPSQLLRRLRTDDLLNRNPSLLEADPAGEPMLRAELVLDAPPAGVVEAALAQGFELLRTQAPDGLDMRIVVLRPPPGVGTVDGAARLRSLDARVQVDFNHLYTPGGTAADPAFGDNGAAGSVRGQGPAASRVGLIDGGIDRRHRALQAATLTTWGCDGVPVANDHGTAIASLLVGQDQGFAGVIAGAHLLAADVYCGKPTGGSVEAVIQALAWLARERVAVINVSLVGPANRLLERAVGILAARGHLVVAAVGNDGPASAPLYPAAYPTVIGVTGVFPTRRVLPEATQGPQVAFAAPGAELAVARSGTSGYTVARGTSFAAPVVAGLLAKVLPEPEPEAAQRVVSALSANAIDLGRSGRDTSYGWGLVGERSRNDPLRVRASSGDRP